MGRMMHEPDTTNHARVCGGLRRAVPHGRPVDVLLGGLVTPCLDRCVTTYNSDEMGLVIHGRIDGDAMYSTGIGYAFEYIASHHLPASVIIRFQR